MRAQYRPRHGGWLRVVFLAAAFLFAGLLVGLGPAEAAKGEDPKGPTLELFKAVELNDMAGVKKSIEAGADLYAQNDEGMTAADLAVDRGHFIVAHYLLSRRLAGQTPPVALVPGRAKEAHKAAKARPKRKFAKPPPKPPAPPPMKVAEPEAMPEKAPQSKSPEMAETVIEVTPDEAGEKAEAPEALETVAEAPEPDAGESGGKPLAEEGPVPFFKSLVDLITPGGGKPPPKPDDTAKEAAAEGAPGTKPGAEPDETIVETAVEQSDEVVVDVTGDVPGDVVVEITDEPAAKLEETDLETVTIEPDLEDPTKTADKNAGDAEAKPEEPKKPEESFLDRMAGLFTSDGKKDGAGEEKPGEKGAAPAVSEIETYDLPLPPPKVAPAKRFSPKFMDKLADFLESGDEKAFKAWLPEMQVMNPGVLSALSEPGAPGPAAEPAQVAAKPESMEPLVPDKAPMAAVEKAPLEPLPGAKPDKEADKEAVPTADKPGMIKGVFNKLVGVLTPDFGDKDRSGRLVLEPDEKLAQAEKKAPSGGDEAETEKPPKFWPVTEVKSAEAPTLAVKKPPRGSLLRTSLTGVTLSLGESVSLENSFPPSGTGLDPHNRCVKKNRGTTLFCLETVDWPEPMQPDFLVPTILYTGQKAIARL